MSKRLKSAKIAVWRSVAPNIPQRHQSFDPTSERFFADSVPLRLRHCRTPVVQSPDRNRSRMTSYWLGRSYNVPHHNDASARANKHNRLFRSMEAMTRGRQLNCRHVHCVNGSNDRHGHAMTRTVPRPVLRNNRSQSRANGASSNQAPRGR